MLIRGHKPPLGMLSGNRGRATVQGHPILPNRDDGGGSLNVAVSASGKCNPHFCLGSLSICQDLREEIQVSSRRIVPGIIDNMLFVMPHLFCGSTFVPPKSKDEICKCRNVEGIKKIQHEDLADFLIGRRPGSDDRCSSSRSFQYWKTARFVQDRSDQKRRLPVQAGNVFKGY